jgi:hypothetical protein
MRFILPFPTSWKRSVMLLLIAGLSAQKQTLEGVIDMHARADPDGTPRSIDAIDLARLAKTGGMRAIVLKNHYEPTASLAYIVRKEVPGIEVFGGISLDLTVGGVDVPQFSLPIVIWKIPVFRLHTTAP